ncbi:hypothetical protein BJX66DRAFT_21578 [Aspergillus keveii]|uniref:Mitochondrial cytochrome c oxidase assembly factor n=1 Tax=Aspergillus keveii TaxID=714993 RepID=A0ABR4FV47_9EURO
MSAILRRLQGGNLEIFKFGMYVIFPIGWMYYFGTNLDERFSVPGFWPTAEQSHKIPLEKEDINKELARMRMADAVKRERRERQQQQELSTQAQEQTQVQSQSSE